MISQAEKSQIKRILQDPSWSAVKHVLDELVMEIEGTSVVRDNEWDTIKAAIEREAKVQGIRSLVDKLYQNV